MKTPVPYLRRRCFHLIGTFMAFFRDGVESPLQFAVFGVKGFDETADAVFTTVGTDQDLTVDSHRRHGF